MKARVNNNETHYEIDGDARAPAVMFSHSLATDLSMWWPQLAQLSDRYRLLRYDTRGHGGSAAPVGPYSLEQLADDAAALLDHLAIDRCHWVGISMGGMVGQMFALRHASRVASLTICDSMCEFPTDATAAWQTRIATAEAQGMAALVPATLERWFSPEFIAGEAEAVARVEAMILATPIAGYVGCSRAIMGLSLRNRLPQIGAETLVVVGENDPGTPVAEAEKIHRGIAGSRLEVIPEVRHLCNIEAASQFNAVVSAFLDGVVSR